MEIKSSEIQLEKLVENLQQTEIWSGKWKETTNVWVKKLTGQTEQPQQFFKEAHILLRLNHPNVVKLLGISTLLQPFYIITECSPDSNLLSLVREDRTITLHFLIEKAMQIAQGMAYIAQKRIVHRDLRASNILLDSENNAKISNFHQAFENEDLGILKKCHLLLVDWTAPESLGSRSWTSASDVWSYGLLLYEIFSDGKVPCSGIDKKGVLSKVKCNYLFPCPVNGIVECPKKVYEIIISCWEKKPEARPRFFKLQRFFQDFLQHLESSSRSGGKLDLLRNPILSHSIQGLKMVRGLAMMDSILYVVRFGSKWIEIYRDNGKHDFKMSKKPILLTQPGGKTRMGILGMINYDTSPADSSLAARIQDMACCHKTKRLFVSDGDTKFLWCVDVTKRKVVGTWSLGDEEPWGISVTPGGEVVVSFADSGNLGVYSEGILVRTVFLKMSDEGPWHAFVFDTDYFVICYGSHYCGPSSVGVVDLDGVHTKREADIWGLSHVAILPNNHIVVAESDHNRVLMFDETLRVDRMREILNQDHGIVKPSRLQYCESSGQLIVGLLDGSILIYRIANADEGRFEIQHSR